MIYDSNEKIIYAFSGGGKFIKAYDLNKKEWIQLPLSFMRTLGFPLVCKYNLFSNKIGSYYVNNNKPGLSYCNLNDKKFEWIDLEFSDEIKNNYSTVTFIP